MGFKKYDLTESQIKKIARLCVQEQGCIAGVKAEASQAANLLETNDKYRNKYGSDIYSFMRNSEWYARAAHYMDNGSASSSAIEAVKDVLCNSNRVFPQYIDEHDDIRDIEYIKLNGEKVSKTNKANYRKGQTIIKNSMGSVYTFWCFPAEGCDPFGYTQKAYDYVKSQGGSGSGQTGVSPDKVIEVAFAEVGYLEKKSAKQLDDKTANAGDANFTKYARDLFPDLQNNPWCDMWVDWCFVKAYGKEKAKKLLGGLSAYTPDSAQYFKDKGRWYTSNPQYADVIFFKNTERICHTGLVYKVAGGRVYTTEGNTSAGEQVIANGGAVCKKSYDLSNPRIAGYGRPDYAGTGGDDIPEPAKKIWVKSQLPMIRKGMSGDAVKAWQIIVGVTPDGDFGSRTLDATVNFQTAHGLDGDGIVGQKTWTEGLNSLE